MASAFTLAAIFDICALLVVLAIIRGHAGRPVVAA
jgi:hypothetical protein